ncbi:MAG: DNA repair protein RadC [Planctomycetota bacterium]
MKKSFTIRDWPSSARPRERLQKYGSDVLSDIELLAVIMGRGTKNRPVLTIAEQLLKEFGSLRAISNASVEELSNIKGIGLAKSTQIKAALQLGRRMDEQPEVKDRPIIKTPDDVKILVEKLVKNKLRDKKKEYFTIIMLDTRNRLIRDANISIGTLDASLVHPREVFKEAISASAASVILVHNHPSGDSAPSDDDIRITKRLIEVGKLVDIEVIDHIIIGGEKCLSMKAEKII